MKDIIKDLVKIGDKEINVMDVMENPAEYPQAYRSTALEEFETYVIKPLLKMRKTCKEIIISDMKRTKATKAPVLCRDGEIKKITLKSGTMKCEVKDADVRYKKAGYDPMEIGEYVFKPSWVRAKEARKEGGDKQKIIDALFKEGNPSIEIK